MKKFHVILHSVLHTQICYESSRKLILSSTCVKFNEKFAIKPFQDENKFFFFRKAAKFLKNRFLNEQIN